jgi:predicted ATP-grasp superfamily ATP-dependent carboligase
VKNEDIEQLSERFLRGVNFLGISEIEFMYDSFDGEYKLLEINPRPWKWHSIVNKLGINFLKIAADYFAGRKIEAELNEKFNVGWIDPLPDFYMFISGLLRRSIKVNEYIDSLKINKESAVFSKDDALPGIAYCLLLPYFFFSRR